MFAMLAALSVPLFLNHACYCLQQTTQRVLRLIILKNETYWNIFAVILNVGSYYTTN